MKLVSVCIPTYEMAGHGQEFLRQSFDILARQTFQDFEVVISDHSQDENIKNLCKEYAKKLTIGYHRNTHARGSSSANLNNAVQKASGKLIKILFQDDFLYTPTSLERIVAAFDPEKDSWLVTASEHSRDGKSFFRPFHPCYNKKIHLGENTISSPSVLTIRNDHPLLFDENLTWLMDCDYYKRCFNAFGAPKILDEINVVNRVGEHQVTNTLATETLRQKERDYVIEKYSTLQLPNVTLFAVACTKVDETIRAMRQSMRGVTYAKAILITHEKRSLEADGITVVNIEKLDYKGYNRFVLYNLPAYITTDFGLLVQNDGFVLRPEKWNERFLNYDYIGAPWTKNVHFTKDGINVRVGNGGFSLRSRKLMRVFNDLNLEFTDIGTGFFHEDGIICSYYRKELEAYGIQFAPVEIASLFSRETKCDDSVAHPFGFHNKRNLPKLLPLRPFLKKIGIPI